MFRARTALIVTTSLLALASTACSDTDNDADAGTQDATTARMDATPSPDAQPPQADAGPLEDAAEPPADAEPAPDADVVPDAEPSPDAMPGVVTVLPPPNIPGFRITAVFQDPNGDLISVKTSSIGPVTETVASGSMITIAPLVATGGGGFLSPIYTVTGVEPGETYQYGFFTGFPVNGDLEISLPGPYTNASYYTVDWGCGENEIDSMGPQTFGILTSCAGTSSTTAALLALAYDSDGFPLAYAYDENVPLVSGGTATVMLPAWQVGSQDLDVTLNNPLANGFDVVVDRSVEVRQAQLHLQNEYLIEPHEDMTVPIAAPPVGTGAGTFITAYFITPGLVSFLADHQAAAGPLTIDLSAELLLPIAELTITGTVTDPERPTINWTPSTQSPDAQILQLTIPQQNAQWHILLTPGTGSFRLPELPDEYAHVRPDGSPMSAGALIVDVGPIPDYATFRRSLGRVLAADILRDIRRGPPGTRTRMASFNFALQPGD